MILSDRDLRARLLDGSIGIDPLSDLEQQLQPASIDLRLGARFRSIAEVDSEAMVTVAEGDAFVLAPGAFALGTTIERVRVPNDLVARVEGRSSIGRIAVIVHATAGFIDPGFEGEITLELANLGPKPARLTPGMRICQIVFHELTSPAERPYGSARGSKYAGQSGPTLSRIDNDPDYKP